MHGKEKKMINTIIFDLGNVLVRFVPMDFLNKLGYKGEMVERMFEAVINNDIWVEFDRGVLEEDEVRKSLIKKHDELESEINRAFKNLHGIIVKADYTEKWIENLKSRGYQVLFLSNLSKKLYSECIDELAFLQKMDGGILSFQAKMIKPEDDIYEKIIRDYTLNPNECIFIDDRVENVEAAKRNGFNGIVFKNYENAREELDSIID